MRKTCRGCARGSTVAGCAPSNECSCWGGGDAQSPAQASRGTAESRYNRGGSCIFKPSAQQLASFSFALSLGAQQRSADLAAVVVDCASGLPAAPTSPALPVNLGPSAPTVLPASPAPCAPLIFLSHVLALLSPDHDLATAAPFPDSVQPTPASPSRSSKETAAAAHAGAAPSLAPRSDAGGACASTGQSAAFAPEMGL